MKVYIPTEYFKHTGYISKVGNRMGQDDKRSTIEKQSVKDN